MNWGGRPDLTCPSLSMIPSVIVKPGSAQKGDSVPLLSSVPRWQSFLLITSIYNISKLGINTSALSFDSFEESPKWLKWISSLFSFETPPRNTNFYHHDHLQVSSSLFCLVHRASSPISIGIKVSQQLWNTFHKFSPLSSHNSPTFVTTLTFIGHWSSNIFVILIRQACSSHNSTWLSSQI